MGAEPVNLSIADVLRLVTAGKYGKYLRCIQNRRKPKDSTAAVEMLWLARMSQTRISSGLMESLGRDH